MTYTAYSADRLTESDATGRRALMAHIREVSWDIEHDPFGEAMVMLGAIVDLLADEGIGIPSAIASGSMGIDWGSDTADGDVTAQELWQGMANGAYSVDDVQYAMFVMSRYVDIVRMAGRDY